MRRTCTGLLGRAYAAAIENYPITSKPIGSYPELVRALALIKQAAALAHKELGQLDATRADAIVAACQEIAGGKLHDEFVVDVIQGGAGTSTNMNANEVIANRALELLRRQRATTPPCIDQPRGTCRRAPATSIRRRCA